MVAVGHHHLRRHRLGPPQQGRRRLRQLQHILFLPRLRRAHADAQHRNVRPHHRQPGDQTGVGSGAAGRGDDAVDRRVQFIGLDHDLAGAVDIAQRPDRVRATAGDDIGLAAPGPHPGRGLFQLGGHVGTARHGADPGPEQPVHQHIAVVRIVEGLRPGPFFQNDLAGQAVRRRRRRRLAHMVGLDRPLGHQGVGRLFKGLAQQEFQLARLVAAPGQAGAVVALDPQFDAQNRAQPGQRLQRRRQMGHADAGKAGEMHGRAPAGTLS